MNVLDHYALHEASMTSATPSRRKLSLQSVLDRLAIGQILREEYVYEVHGPFVADEPAPPRPRLAAWMIAKLSG
ncbi:hypothetical protein DK26_17515 [Bosea sp. WAO]|uniref:hypothetical protein n=1 Tax=Bosea sp. WAO TaxID=406341 RepID=UPI000747FA9D|nr:hypothetical protein [Bosea sp. WAO]KUL94690.1 hypothetical protein DK26_17515 [Bosea sp. WAO]